MMTDKEFAMTEKRLLAAWIEDHPGRTAKDFQKWSSCAATDKQANAWDTGMYIPLYSVRSSCV